jgi:hypothetical protein
MTLTMGTPSGPFIIGPGAPIVVSTSIAQPTGYPLTLQVFFTDALDGTFSWSQSVLIPSGREGTIRPQWDADGSPSTLLENVHQKTNGNVNVRAELRSDDGALIDTGPTISVPWDPVVWAMANTRLWQDHLVARLSGGGSGDKIDQILAAVYRTWRG